MGQEIVYCSFCRIRLTSSDFDKGRAFRSGFRISCKACHPLLVAAGPPEDVHPPRESRPPRKGSSTHIPPVVLHRDAGSAKQVWPFATVGGAALLAVLLAALSAARPARPRPVRDEPVSVAPRERIPARVPPPPSPPPSPPEPRPDPGAVKRAHSVAVAVVGSVRKPPPAENEVRGADRPEPAPPDLELWLRFGEAAKDSSGRGNVGLIVGEAGLLDQALSVDRDGHLRIPDAPHLRFRADQSFTVAAWARASEPRGGYQGVVTKSRDQMPHYGLWTGHGKWVFGGSQQNIEAGSVATGWQHVVGVQDGPAGRRTLYVNGVSIGSAGAQPGDGPGELRVGSTAGPTEYFGGMIDDVRVYSRALAPEEVALLYKQGR